MDRGDLVHSNNPDSYLAEAQPASVPWVGVPVSGASFVDPSTIRTVSLTPIVETLCDVFGETPERAQAIISEHKGEFITRIRSCSLSEWVHDEFRTRISQGKLHGFVLSNRPRWSFCLAASDILISVWRDATRYVDPGEPLKARWHRHLAAVHMKMAGAELKWVCT